MSTASGLKFSANCTPRRGAGLLLPCLLTARICMPGLQRTSRLLRGAGAGGMLLQRVKGCPATWSHFQMTLERSLLLTEDNEMVNTFR